MCAATVDASVPEQPGGSPIEADWLLANADWIVTCDGEMRRIPTGTLVIHGDTIAAVGTLAEIEPRFRCRTRLDLRGHIILPGLVNTHTHAAMSCFRGLGDDLPLRRWLNEVIFPAEAKHVNPEMVYWGTLLSSVEMLLGGVTTFCDGYFFEQAAAQAALDAGIRAVLGQGILDFPTPDQPDPARSRERAEAFLTAFPPNVSRLRPSLFCHSPYTCNPETLRWVKDLCRERGILFQIHLSETASEVEEIIQKHGERPVPYLDRLGILDENTLCAHAVWIDPEETVILAARRAAVSHNAESNMKLASGVAPVTDMLDSCLRVGIGTDGCASNNNLDILTEMDTVAKLHKVFRKDPTVCSAPQVLAMATCQGAAAIGWENEIGSLRPGKKADITVIDIRQPHLTPMYDPVSHLVYAATGGDVRHVWVDGRLVVSDGKVQNVDVDDVMGKVQSIAEKVKAGYFPYF